MQPRACRPPWVRLRLKHTVKSTRAATTIFQAILFPTSTLFSETRDIFCSLLCQVAYTGLLQMFLTPRAVSLLVCNTEAFGRRDGCSSDRNELMQDQSKLKELRMCDWLRSLSLRIPESDVVIVATKCDLVGGMAVHLAQRMERAVRTWIEKWRGSQMTAVRVEDGVSLTSCVATLAPGEEGGAASKKRKKPEPSMWACDWREGPCDDSLPSLLKRIVYNSKGELRGSAMVLPRSWNIALEVLDALGSGRQVQPSGGNPAVVPLLLVLSFAVLCEVVRGLAVL